MPPAALESDPPQVTAVLNLHGINIDAWLMSLSKKDLEKLKSDLGTRTGKLDYIANMNLAFVRESVSLKATV